MIPAGQAKIEWASCPPTVLTEPGGFVGLEPRFDERRNRLEGIECLEGSYNYEDALKVITCSYGIEPRDVTQPVFTDRSAPLVAEMFGSGTGGLEWDLQDHYSPTTGKLQRKTTRKGEWRLVAPEWNYGGYVAWQVYASTPGVALTYEDLWYLRSETKIPANRPFALQMARQATPTAEERPEGYYFTGVRFGGCFELRIPKWDTTVLRKLVSGAWKTVAEWDWQVGKFYKDEGSERALWVLVWPLDGRLLVRTSLSGEANVYEEARPFGVPEATIAFCGNGGSAGFGLHELRFVQPETESGLNLLAAEETTHYPYRPVAAPTPVLIGRAPDGTTARVVQVTGEPPVPQTPTTATEYRVGVEFGPDAEGIESPVIRMAGLSYPTRVTLSDPAWLDISADLQEGEGTQEFSIERRTVTRNCRVTLDNADGRYRAVRGAKLMRVSLGRYGLVCRYIGIAYLDEANREGLGLTEGSFEVIDRLEPLEEIECGYRRPLDGALVCDALEEVFSWGRFHSSEIGTFYNSGVRLPTTAYASASWAGAAAGVLDNGAAAVQFRPETTIGEAYRYLMGWDAWTGIYFDGVTGRVEYRQIIASSPATRTFVETETLDGQDAIRGGASRRPRLRDIATAFRVEGVDRRTGLKLGATAWDRAKVQSPTVTGFRALDKSLAEHDDSRGSQAELNLRCRYLYDFHHRLREERGFESLGQPDLFPPSKVIVSETVTGEEETVYILAVHDMFDGEGRYDGQIEAVAWATA